MKFSNENNNKNLISSSLGFYLYELLGVDYSGVYLSSVELKEAAASIGIDIIHTDNQQAFGVMLEEAKAEGKLALALIEVKKLFETRIESYKELADRFPSAVSSIEEWRIKAERAVRKIDNSIKEVQNESVSS